MQQMNVPWLPKKKIADLAAGVVAGYAAKLKRNVQPPIPVENIIERGLNLSLGFVDLRTTLDMDDVLGATFIKKRLVCVDESLLKDKFEGRLCFTVAHETGHWILHKELIDLACRSDGQGGFIFCRVKDAKKPIEWQADYFASCLLMPEKAVKYAFYEIYGLKPLILYNVKSAFSGPICFDPCVENWPIIATKVIEAGGFKNVSKQAMIIRLQDLGLVKNETRARFSWKESHVMV